MQIDTSLGNYNNNGRAGIVEKAVIPSEQVSESTRNRVPLNPSFSRAVLSNALANVLWEVDGSRVASPRNSQFRSDNLDRDERRLNWVRNAYAEND